MVDRDMYQVYIGKKKFINTAQKGIINFAVKTFAIDFLAIAESRVRAKNAIHMRSFRHNTTFGNCQGSTAKFCTVKFMFLVQKYYPELQYKNLAVFSLAKKHYIFANRKTVKFLY